MDDVSGTRVDKYFIVRIKQQLHLFLNKIKTSVYTYSTLHSKDCASVFTFPTQCIKRIPFFNSVVSTTVFEYVKQVL